MTKDNLELPEDYEPTEEEMNDTEEHDEDPEE